MLSESTEHVQLPCRGETERKAVWGDGLSNNDCEREDNRGIWSKMERQ